MVLPKYRAELAWWAAELADRIVPWYRGEIAEIWGFALPDPKVDDRPTERENAAATLASIANYYLHLLFLEADQDYGRTLDIGAGPLLPGLHLPKTELWCLDPMFAQYRLLGFPVTDTRAVLLDCPAEDMWSSPAAQFDTIISHNALDHVDDFERTVQEIERVAKPDALIRFRIAIHSPTPTEPCELSTERVCKAFSRPMHMLDARYGEQLWSTP